MAQYQDREYYIPLRKSDLIDLLCNDRGFAHEQAEQFRRLADLLTATFHFEYHQKLEELKNAYAPFDPDLATQEIAPLSPERRADCLHRLFQQFSWLMERANFKRLDQKVIEKSTREVSDWGLNMDVDFDVFERMELFVRGDVTGIRYRRRWTNWFRLESVQLPIFQRLVLMLKLKKSKRLPANVDVKHVFLKIFKDIPHMDLEMLLPGARIKMPYMQRVKLGGSVLSGAGFVIYSVVKSIVQTAAFGVSFLLGPLAAIGGYGFKQYYGYQSTKTQCSLQLTQSLYFQNLGNNRGVLFALLDEAEEQECREALLAYYTLWRHAGPDGWKATELDDYVEMDLERLANLKVDFEVEDALAKLERLRLVTKREDRFAAVPIDQALERLDHAWDNFFQYNKINLDPINQ